MNSFPEKKEINIELSQEVSKGQYSNLAIITHSSSEFVIDFARMLPGVPKAEVASRIIMTAEHAKRLYLALQDNIRKFEDLYGEINTYSSGRSDIPMPFGPNSAEA